MLGGSAMSGCTAKKGSNPKTGGDTNGRRFAEDIFKYGFLNENYCILIQCSNKKKSLMEIGELSRCLRGGLAISDGGSYFLVTM